MKEYILLTHGISGYVIFVLGLAQYLMKKGGKNHRIIGRIYLYTWFVLVASGAYIGNVMITFLGLFGLYYAISGARFAMVKKQPNSSFDKALSVLGLLCSISILASAYIVYNNGNLNFAIIFVFFGLIFSINVSKDVRAMFFGINKNRLSEHRMYWYFEHYTRFTISFIAALTAFSAIQNITGVVVINWLLPTLIGTIYLVAMGKKHRKQFKIN